MLGSDPPNGAVLASSPKAADVVFDDPVRVGTRNAAIRNADGESVLGGRPFVRQSRTLVIPLQPNLRDGNYTVRWSIVSDDGHHEEGVIAFGVGEGGGTPTAALGTRGSVTWQQVAMRGDVLPRRARGGRRGVLRARRAAAHRHRRRTLLRRHALLLGVSFLVAFVGADALIHATAGSATRFERCSTSRRSVAVVGALAAGAALYWARAICIAWAAAAVLFVCPTLSGHALDGDQPRLLAPLADLLHLGAAAVWLGGLASLAARVPARRGAARARPRPAASRASRSRWCSCSSPAASRAR